jgi:hypothetical protein
MRHYRFLSHLSSFTGRAVVFFFISSALLCFFYIVGNDQDFLDSTQLLLLGALRLSLGLELASSVWFAGFLLYRAITEKHFFIVRWILLVLSLAACAAFFAVLRFVQQWLQS